MAESYFLLTIKYEICIIMIIFSELIAQLGSEIKHNPLL
jgi:hypothetical protein